MRWLAWSDGAPNPVSIILWPQYCTQSNMAVPTVLAHREFQTGYAFMRPFSSHRSAWHHMTLKTFHLMANWKGHRAALCCAGPSSTQCLFASHRQRIKFQWLLRITSYPWLGWMAPFPWALHSSENLLLTVASLGELDRCRFTEKILTPGSALAQGDSSYLIVIYWQAEC